MTLQNLLRIGRVKPHSVSAQEIARLLAASERNIADAQVTRISAETRFDAGYKAVMQCALAAMMASGYRPSTSEAGHHATLIQSLPLTLSVPDDAWVVLDALRRKRNANDYTGDVVTADMVVECIAQAQALRAALIAHLQRNHPQLLG
ncbi:MAG: DNA-binding protein [Betaproteobacteria bacterium]|nr:DNA-binding protein [Betaproteobacteria bacterium]